MIVHSAEMQTQADRKCVRSGDSACSRLMNANNTEPILMQ